jgi:hypothetical protein
MLNVIFLWAMMWWPQSAGDVFNVPGPRPTTTVLYESLDSQSRLWVTRESIPVHGPPRRPDSIYEQPGRYLPSAEPGERYTLQLLTGARRKTLATADCVESIENLTGHKSFSFYDAKREGNSLLIVARFSQMVALCDLSTEEFTPYMLKKGKCCVLTWDVIESGVHITSATIRGDLHDGTLVVRLRNDAREQVRDTDYAVTFDGTTWNVRTLEKVGDPIFRQELRDGVKLEITGEALELPKPLPMASGPLEACKGVRYHFYVNDDTAACGWKEIGGTFDEYWFKGLQWAADPPTFLATQFDGQRVYVLCKRNRLIQLFIIDSTHARPPRFEPAIVCDLRHDEPSPAPQVVGGTIEGSLESSDLHVRLRLSSAADGSQECGIRLVDHHAIVTPVAKVR